MIQSIQFLRAFAAIIVAFRHLHGLYVKRQSELGLPDPFWSGDTPIVSFGEVGVDIFFVISGFIIFYTSWDRSYKTLEFLKKRILRIYPPYWIATLLAVGIALAPGASGEVSWREFLLSMTLFPFFQPDGKIHPFLAVGWTLTYEMLFYLCCGLLMFLGAKKRLVFLTVVFSALVLSRSFVPQDQAWMVVATNPKLLEFVVGGWFAWAFRAGFKLEHWQGIALCLVVVALFAMFLAVPGWREGMGALPRGSFATALVAVALFYPTFSERSYGSLFLLLGNASYSIYLVHSLPMQLISGLWKRGILVPSFPVISFWIVGVAIIAGGLVFYLLVEKPAMSALHRLPRWKRKDAALPA